MKLEAHCLPTGIGSVPQADPKEACEFVLSNFEQIPFWPQLPKRDHKEDMYTQYSEGLPGRVLEDRLYADSSKLMGEAEKFYEDYLAEKDFPVSMEYANGLYEFLKRDLKDKVAIKGQVTGPISFGLQVTDENRKAIIYNDTMKDTMLKLLQRKCFWQEKELQKLNKNTIMFIDEPYMSAFGSAHVSLNREEVIAALEEVMQGISGLKGVHCCGNTDWSLLLDTSIDILSFDAFEFVENLALYAEQVQAYLSKGGILAWGIVPTGEEVHKESVDSLEKRLEDGMALLASKGVDKDLMISNGLVTPACGVGSREVPTATKVFGLAKDLSARLRETHGV